MKGNLYFLTALHYACVAFFLFTGTSILRAQNNCVSPPSGLVGWWRGEDNADDSAGTNNGTLINGGSYTNGEVGQAFSLEGTDAGVEIPASPSLDVGTGNGMTIEGWINPSAINDERTIFEWNNGSIWGANFDFSTPPGAGPYGTGPGCLFVNLVDTGGNYHWLSSPAGIIQTNVFQHVAFTYDKSSGLAVLYLNGSVAATSNLGNNFTAQTSYDAYLGVRINNPPVASQWAGMDEMSLYNRALSSNEIAAIYNAGSGGKCAKSGTCDPAPSGIVAWWPGEGNADDIIGTNNGVPQSILYADGEVGQAFFFNGSSSQVEVPASPSLNVGLGNGFTIETWINPASFSTGVPVALLGWYDEAGDFGTHLWLSTDHGANGNGFGNLFADLTDTSGNSHQIYSAANVMIANELQHVALTYDKTTGIAVLYRNGVAVQTVNLGIFTPQTSFDFSMGDKPTGLFAGNYFEGEMDELTIYSHALSSNEIVAIYNAGSGGKCTESGTCDPTPLGAVSWWPAEDNANDIIGTNNGVSQSITYTNGEAGQAFAFNGSGSQIEVPASPSLNVGLGNGFTLESWIKPTSLDLQSLFEWNQNIGGGSGYAQIGAGLDIGVAGPGDLYANIVDTNANSHIFYSINSIIVANTFQHVALTYDKTSGIAALYCNGVAVASTNLGSFTPQTSFDLFMGVRPSGIFSGIYFQGIMDEPTLYNRALTSNEIAAIYNAGSDGKCVPEPPLIFSQPTNETIIAGNPATFGVTVAGSLPLSYQWYFNGTNQLVGETNAQLTLMDVQLTNTGFYSVTVTNLYGSTNSFSASLAVVMPPLITTQPTNQTVYVGSTATFKMTAIGSLPLFYQWYFNGTNNLKGETNTTLTLTDVQLTNAGIYSVMVTNFLDYMISSNAVLMVNPLPTLTTIQNANFLLLFWPTNSTGFVLETTPTLLSANWVAISSSPIQIGNQYYVPVQITGTNAFYRLRLLGH
jgi:Concanavalin A-like lectin/glucanases superfamily/Immunoglobulin domain